ncbi:MAG: hypothetical protein LUG98_09540 [Tannerellaceae bacterium]|nr:hypothetical protein [Tannerellaceae bacterium]
MATTETTTAALTRANQEILRITSGWQTFQGQLTQAAGTVSRLGSLFETSVNAIGTDPGDQAVAGEPGNQADPLNETAGKIANTTDNTWNSFRKSDLITGKIRILLNHVSQATTKIVEQLTALTGSVEEALNKNTRTTQVGVIVKYPPQQAGGDTIIHNTISVNNHITTSARMSADLSGQINNNGGTDHNSAGETVETYEKVTTSVSKIQESYSAIAENISNISSATTTWSATIEKTIETYTSLSTSIQQATEVSVLLSETIRAISQTTTLVSSSIEQVTGVTATLAISLERVQEITATLEDAFYKVDEACADIFTHIGSLTQHIQAEITNVVQTTNTFQQSLTQVNITAGNLQIGINQVTDSSGRLEETLGQVSNTMDEVSQMTAHVNTTMDTLASGMESIRDVAGMAQSNFELMTSTLEKLNQRIDTLQTVSGTAGQEIGNMGETVQKTTEKSSWLGTTFGKMKEKVLSSINDMMGPMKILNTLIGKAAEFLQGSGAAWKARVEVEGNLSNTMTGNMGAGENEINSLLQLTAAQEKLGVVSRNVQTAGAVELAAHLNKSESLEQLLPAMNNLIAKQHGLNATQEHASAMAGLMAQALNGETGELARCGIEFTELQKQILTTGTETERATILAEAMETSIGGVNAALAATPEGQFKNQANSLEDLQSRIGSLYEQVMVALMPLFDKFREGLDGVISLFEKHEEKISNGINTIATICGQAFTIVIEVLDSVISLFSSWFEELEGGNIWVTAITTAVGLLAGIIAAVTIATNIWSTAQAVLNTIMNLNPIGLIIAAIAGFIALIGYLCSRLQGWGTLWEGLVGFMEHTFAGFVATIKFRFTSVINALMIGLNYIKKGWYQFREACGIGDSSENQAALREINADIEARQQAIVNGAREIMEHARAAKDSLSGINMSWKKDETGETEESRETVQETVNKTQEIVDTVTHSGTKTTTTGTSGDSGSNLSGSNQQNIGGSIAENTVSSISNTGSQSRSIVINLGSMVENIIFNGGFDTNREEVEKDLEESLLNVLQMAYTAQ